MSNEESRHLDGNPDEARDDGNHDVDTDVFTTVAVSAVATISTAGAD